MAMAMFMVTFWREILDALVAMMAAGAEAEVGYWTRMAEAGEIEVG